jgi:NTP pyrophosphatase (non-canonical NTP hydrolase)
MVLLTEEVGEVAKVLRGVRNEALRLEREEGVVSEEALRQSLETSREALGAEIADCLAYLFKLANRAGVDVHESYRAKMARNVGRTWGYGDRSVDSGLGA